MTSPQPTEPQAQGEPDWFREPTAREHRIAAALFVGFGVFFLTLFVVLWGWWFRWVIAALGVYSLMHGMRHLLDSRAVARQRNSKASNPPARL